MNQSRLLSKSVANLDKLKGRLGGQEKDQDEYKSAIETRLLNTKFKSP
jgi:hypothetical protein